MTDMEKAFQANLDSLVSNDLFKSVQTDYQRDLEAIEHRLTNLRESTSQEFDIAFKTIELSHQAETLYLCATLEQQRKLLGSLLSICQSNG